MPNHNIFIVTGHLGRDAEVKFLTDGKPVTRFTLANSTGYGDKKNTTWYKCSAFGERYSKLASWLSKGKSITVIGEHSAREWTGENGVKHTDCEIRVSDIVLLGSRDDQQHQPATHPAAAPAAEPHDESIPF